VNAAVRAGSQTLAPDPGIYRVRGSGEEADVTDAGSERQRRFDCLFRENVAGIAAYCRWRSLSPGDEQDAVAEVFLIAWRRLDQVPRDEKARAWLYAPARRVMSHQARAMSGGAG
jgi:DNA-directed RNA polymerase specialized sigma24 family protein